MPGVAQKRTIRAHAHRLCHYLPALMLALLLVISKHPALAQTSAGAYLSPPDTHQFPRITTYLDVQESQGFLHGLQASEVQIHEDGAVFAVTELQEIHPGIQLIVAVSPGPSFDIHDVLGNSRYSYVNEALRAWSGVLAQTPPDDFSLIAAGYPEALYFSSPRDWYAAFSGYQPDAANAKPTLDTLARALDVAKGKTPRAGMGRAVLFITAPQDAETTASLEGLVARARLGGIHVFVWLIAAPEVLTTPGALQLQNLADQTGGQFFAFSGAEKVPELDEILEPHRYAYALSYDSGIKSSGIHQISADINAADFQGLSASTSFEIIVSPPNPIFVSLPSSIVRAKAEVENGQKLVPPSGSGTDFAPIAQSLEVMIEFPDGYPRQTTRTVLYVDGVLADENTSPPFEKFTWDLRSYLQSGKHILRVEAVDSLGLTGTTMDTGVHIVVQQPKRHFLSLLLSWQNALLAGLVVLAAGILAILLLVLGGRLRPQWAGDSFRSNPQIRPVRRRIAHRSVQSAARPAEEASTQRIPNWFSHLTLHQRRPSPTAPAFLVPISEAEEMPPVAPIPITTNVVTFGRDGVRATLVLDDGSVDEVHARLQRENNQFRLVDSGSIAGTWVNFTPVSQEGTILESGDFIHIGRIGFRFTQREPGHVRKPVVLLQPAGPEKQA